LAVWIIEKKEELRFHHAFSRTLTAGWKNLRQRKSTLGEHIALLSVKYNVYPSEIFQALIIAKENGKANCGDISVEFRGQIKGETIFLVKKNGNVLAQFRVDQELLLRKDNPFEGCMSTEKIRKKIARQNTEEVYTTIQALRTGMKKINVKAEVLEMPKPAQVHTQFGNTVMVVNALVGDETGTIKLCLWEGQINSINSGDNIEIKNAQVCMFRGERQLRLGKNGLLNISPAASIKQVPSTQCN
jgi:replication factor A1